MENLIRLETVSEFNAFNNQETLHPLVSVIDMSKLSVVDMSKHNPGTTFSTYFGLYTVFLKEVK
jgi:AraC family transcriptional activator of pobA